jgi:hypothetical protein
MHIVLTTVLARMLQMQISRFGIVHEIIHVIVMLYLVEAAPVVRRFVILLCELLRIALVGHALGDSSNVKERRYGEFFLGCMQNLRGQEANLFIGLLF